jgi:hypothetical protein
MRPQKLALILILVLSPVLAAAAAAKDKSPPSYEEARQASWTLANALIETLDDGDAKQWPGTHAWLKDLGKQTTS